MEDSIIPNFSGVLQDGFQKDKMKQMEQIAEILKDKGKFMSVLQDKNNAVKPIINFWKQGKTKMALEQISK